MINVEVAETHPGVVGGGEMNAAEVLTEVAVVEGDVVVAERAGGVYGGIKADEGAAGDGVASVILAHARVDGRNGRADAFGVVTCLDGVDGLPFGSGAGHFIAEGAAVEFDAAHLPHCDVVLEGAALGGEQVTVVHREGAAGEVGGVVGDRAAGGVVLVLEESSASPVVAEEGVGGLHDAAGVLVNGIGVGTACADGCSGVLDGGVVEDDAALCQRRLADVVVPFHDDALPHFALAGRGERAAVHNQLAAGAHDDAATACDI